MKNVKRVRSLFEKLAKKQNAVDQVIFELGLEGVTVCGTGYYQITRFPEDMEPSEIWSDITCEYRRAGLEYPYEGAVRVEKVKFLWLTNDSTGRTKA